MTDNEIMTLDKALFILRHGSAEGEHKYFEAIEIIESEINRQKAEIERLKLECGLAKFDKYKAEFEEFRAEIKAGAIKEFAESQHVVELPFLPGDDLYWIDDETMKIECQPHGIEDVVYYGNGKFKIVDDGEIEDVGGQWTLLSREDAEMFLRKKLKRSDEVGRSQVD